MSNSLARFFPPPTFLTGPAVGLDISDQSVKFVELTGRAGQVRFVRAGWSEIPRGAIEAGVIKDAKAVTAVLARLAEEHQLKQVIVALPEEQTYIIELDLPKVRASQIRESVELSVVDYLRFPAAEAVLDFELLPDINQADAWLPVVATVLPQAVAQSYGLVLTAAGLTPTAFELESQALARALLSPGVEAVMIIDIGRARTSFYAATNGIVRYGATINTVSGDILTKRLIQQKNWSLEEAERQKINQGLIGEAAVATALEPLVVLLSDEIEHRLFAWSHDNHQSLLRTDIKRIVLIGGQATLPGLAGLLENRLKLPVTIGNPWQNTIHVNQLVDIPFNYAVGLATAVGLALRNIW
ncbi:MAG: hypothetical protein COV09_00285 [Candidatus Vogelbacteria bacterium CG10_big_fil_rev_8_21_14_0_10_50_13]|uniref:SHS2 domain-containing protein n=1 Tax=Candidatus Vogelbacteria bacterium CG10_big_fil_rev_8_21_14_0_10_50_13 TaxID=1975044 RepID=A0A2H0RGX9_9BACT|nr:MAG: hypothetical protein COV09_00285 [Candidatus Vogelbacteria bacterium CG10_big_fil_rev_8_21_14_0_10_50_13]